MNLKYNNDYGSSDYFLLGFDCEEFEKDTYNLVDCEKKKLLEEYKTCFAWEIMKINERVKHHELYVSENDDRYPFLMFCENEHKFLNKEEKKECLKEVVYIKKALINVVKNHELIRGYKLTCWCDSISDKKETLEELKQASKNLISEYLKNEFYKLD